MLLSCAELEKILSRELCDTKIWIRLAQKLSERLVISKDVYKIITSLSGGVNSQVIARYILRQVGEKVESEDQAYSTFIEVLSELNLHSLCAEITLLRSFTGSSQTCDMLSAKDIPALMKKLAPVAYKWYEIGIALILPRNVMKECESKGNNILKLNEVIYEWVMGNHEHALQPTLSNLNECLTGPLVGVHEISISSKSEHTKPHCKRAKLSLKIEYASGDCEVTDGKSTLLEVRASISEGVSYQWMKDSEYLSDGEDYCGTRTDILVIKHAHQGMEGQYTCTVERGQEKLVSQETKVKIVYSQEKESLLLKYVCQREVPKDSWPPVITKTFTNLVLIEQTKMQTNKYSYSMRGNIDDIVESKEKIEYSTVFGQYQSGSFVLVEGRPGSGKTTLVHKVVRDWAVNEGTLKGAKLVFLVPLRLLQVVGSDKSLSDLIDFIYCDSEMSSSIATECKKTLGEGICIILDGLDEYQRRDASDSIVYQLTLINCLPNAMIIVASRPVASSRLKHSDVLIKHIEVIGFNYDQIFHFISNYPFEMSASMNSIVSKIRSHFDLHPNLLHMCYLPVHAAMICYLFQDFQGTLPVTKTEVYFEFTKSLVLRSLHRKDSSIRIQSFSDLPAKEYEHFQNLCRLAFYMTIQSQQIARHSNIIDSIWAEVSIDDSSFLGLVNIEHSSDRCGHDKFYSFLHLSLQEYLAAYFMAIVSDDDQITAIQRYWGCKEMYQVWLFFCGIVKKADKLIELAQIFPYQYFSYPFLFQCAFESQLKPVCDAVKALELSTQLCLSNILINPMDFIAIEYVLSDSPPILKRFSLIRCLFDKKSGSQFISFISSKCDLQYIQCMRLSCCDVTPQCVLELIQSIHYNKCLKTVELNQCSLCSQGLVALAKWMKDNDTVKALDISGNPLIGYEGMTAIAEALQCNTAVQTLELSPCDITENPLVITKLLQKNNTINNFSIVGHSIWENQIGVGWNAFMFAIMEGLQFNKSISALTITSTTIDVRSFLDMLSCNRSISHINLHQSVIEGDCKLINFDKNSSLKSLRIIQTKIATNSLFYGLKLMPQLIELTIVNVYINSEGVSILANSIGDSVQIFHLIQNRLGYDGLQALSAGLKLSNLSCLSIVHNGIGPNSIPAVIDLISNNKSIRDIDLGSNKLGSDGIKTLSSGLNNSGLRQLCLSDNNLGPRAGAAIAELINNNQKVHIVDLKNNKIGSDGIIALDAGIRRGGLRELNLSSNDMCPRAVKAIAGLIGKNQHKGVKDLKHERSGLGGAKVINPNDPFAIEVLNLKHNMLGTKGVIELSTRLKDCELYQLDLSYNCIGPEAGKAIADLINNNKIYIMDLIHNNLGSDGVRELANNKMNSCNLYLMFNNVTQDCEELTKINSDNDEYLKIQFYAS